MNDNVQDVNNIGTFFETKFISPSNVRGARIKVIYYDSENNKEVKSYSYDYSANDAHLSALEKFLKDTGKENFTILTRVSLPTSIAPKSYFWQVCRM